jgi:hypothetical protein
MNIIRLLALGAFTMLAACGFTNPGSGTGTLEVNAIVHYNAGQQGSLAPVTNVQISVQKNGLPVSSPPTVTLQDADSSQTYTVDVANGNKLTQQIPGYHRRWILAVTSGSDNLTCKLESPGPFTLSNPLQGALISQSGGLNVSWQTQDGVMADKVEVSLSTIQQTNTPSDTGSYEFPASQLQLGDQTVTVLRINQVVPAGATGSSVFQSEYEVDVAFTVEG